MIIIVITTTTTITTTTIIIITINNNNITTNNKISEIDQRFKERCSFVPSFFGELTTGRLFGLYLTMG